MNGITMDQWLKMVPDSVVNLPEGLRNLLFQLYQTFIAADRWKWFLNGLKITFAVTIGALILGVIIGLLIAIVRTAHDSRRMGKSNIILSILNAICKLYLTVIRGTPMMVQLLIMGLLSWCLRMIRHVWCAASLHWASTRARMLPRSCAAA